MNSNMESSLTELKQSNAVGLPNASSIEKAKDGTSWHGKKKDGSSWRLTKNNKNSYTCLC